MVKLTYRLVRDFDAEAVCIISNQKLTRKVVYGMMSRGIPSSCDIEVDLWRPASRPDVQLPIRAACTALSQFMDGACPSGITGKLQIVDPAILLRR